MAVAGGKNTRSTVLACWCNKLLELSLKESEISFIENEKSVYSVNLQDVIGLKVIEKPGLGEPNSCQTELYTYSQDHTITNKHKRHLSFVPILFNTEDSFESNKKAALDFRREIQCQCLKNDQRSLMGIEDQDPVQPRFLVVINPYSGRKQSVKQYRKNVQPFFEIAGVTVVEELVTERQNHAKEFIQTFDFSRITGIITIGGDGIIFEIINGIMCRSDNETVLKTPIGVIPTGSGNSIISSLLYERGEEYNMLNAVYQVLHGGVQSIDLATVTTSNETYYMFTALTWGIIADTDIESESMRFLGGEMRELFGAIKSILRKRSYHGRLSYLPMKKEDDTIVKEQHDTSVVTDNVSTVANSVEQDDSTINVVDNQNDDSDQQHNVSQQDKPSDPSLGQGLEEETDDSKTQASMIVSDSTSPNHTPNLTPSSSSIMPLLTDPVPNEWVTIESDFVSVLVGMVPLLTTKFFIHPNATLGCGHFNVVIMDNSLSRGDVFSVMTGMGTGEYINYPYVNIVQACACRIEPMTTLGRIVVDGEEVKFGPIQMEINKSINIFSRNKTVS